MTDTELLKKWGDYAGFEVKTESVDWENGEKLAVPKTKASMSCACDGCDDVVIVRTLPYGGREEACSALLDMLLSGSHSAKSGSPHGIFSKYAKKLGLAGSRSELELKLISNGLGFDS